MLLDAVPQKNLCLLGLLRDCVAIEALCRHRSDLAKNSEVVLSQLLGVVGYLDHEFFVTEISGAESARLDGSATDSIPMQLTHHDCDRISTSPSCKRPRIERAKGRQP